MKNFIPLFITLIALCILPYSQAQVLLQNENLSAVQQDNSWDRTTNWLTWSQNTDIYHMIGFNNSVDYYAMQRFTTSDLAPYNGMQLTQVRFLPSNVASEPTSATYTVVVYTGGSYEGYYLYNSPGTLRCSQVVNDITYGHWKTVVLSTPITINSSQELWIGVRVQATQGYAMSHDDATAVAGKGDLMGYNGYWGVPDDFLTDPEIHNWNVAGCVSDGVVDEFIDLKVKFINNGTSQTQISSLNVPTNTSFRPVAVVHNDNSFQAQLDYTDTITLRGYMDGNLFSTHRYFDTLVSGRGIWMNILEMSAAEVFQNGYCGTTHNFCYEVEVPAGWNDCDLTNNSACITVSFANYSQLYHITVLNTDSTVSPSGVVDIYPGGNQRFVITPPEGMAIDQVLADDVDVTGDVHYVINIGRTYTFSNVQSDHTLLVTYREDGVGMEEQPENALRVYPNPATTRLYLDGVAGIQNVTVFDLAGRSVLSSGVCTDFDISTLPAGSYILHVATNQGVERATFIKTSLK